jgi:hypothetical protein
MKKFYLLFFATLILFANCTKDSHLPISTSTLNVINGAIDVPVVQVNTSGQQLPFTGSRTISYGNGGLFSIYRGISPITIVSSTDTTKNLFSGNIPFTSGIYSLYLAGQSPTVDTILREETNFPLILSGVVNTTVDSVVNLRFVNLSPNSVPLKIKLLNATTNEVDNLGYKGITNFKPYAALLTTTTYTFQIRNAATDALLTTYSFSATATNRFKNVALLIKGLMGTTTGTNAFSVSAVNYF